MASPETSRRDSGEATPRRILLELPPDPTDGARVLLVDGATWPDRLGTDAPRHRIDPGDFGPVLESIAPSVLPPGPRTAPGATGPLLPEEILAASGRPGERRPTPHMSALDWVRVFGPLGSEDRPEGSPDGPAWAARKAGAAEAGSTATVTPTATAPDTAPSPPESRPPGETASGVSSGLADLSLMALLDELAPVATTTAEVQSVPSPDAAPVSEHRPVRTRRRRRWLPVAAAAAVVAVPSTAVLAGLVLGDEDGGPSSADVGPGTPTGTTAAPGEG